MYACGVLTDYLRNLFLEKADEYIIQIIKKLHFVSFAKGLKLKMLVMSCLLDSF